MKKAFGVCVIIMMSVILVSGCNDGSKKQASKLESIETNMDIDSKNKDEDEDEDKSNQTETNVDLNSNGQDKLFKFKTRFPDATVYNTAMLDIDGDNTEDLIVIFDTPEKKVNFAILAKGVVNTIALEGDDYSFTYVPESLKIDKSQNKFIITLYDEAKNFTVDYEMSMVYDKKEKARTLKIESVNPR